MAAFDPNIHALAFVPNGGTAKDLDYCPAPAIAAALKPLIDENTSPTYTFGALVDTDPADGMKKLVLNGSDGSTTCVMIPDGTELPDSNDNTTYTLAVTTLGDVHTVTLTGSDGAVTGGSVTIPTFDESLVPDPANPGGFVFTDDDGAVVLIPPPVVTADYVINRCDGVTAVPSGSAFVTRADLVNESLGLVVQFVADPADATGCTPAAATGCAAITRAITIGPNGDMWEKPNGAGAWVLRNVNSEGVRVVSRLTQPGLNGQNSFNDDPDLQAAIGVGTAYHTEIIREAVITNDDCVPWLVRMDNRVGFDGLFVDGNQIEIAINNAPGNTAAWGGGSPTHTFDNNGTGDPQGNFASFLYSFASVVILPGQTTTFARQLQYRANQPYVADVANDLDFNGFVMTGTIQRVQTGGLLIG